MAEVNFEVYLAALSFFSSLCLKLDSVYGFWQLAKMSDICRTSGEVEQESASLLARQVYVSLQQLGNDSWMTFSPI